MKLTIFDALKLFYHSIGSIICHQLPQRTIYVDGLPLPVCARDTGIYTGIFIAVLYIFVKGRFKSDKPPKLIYAVVLCLMMLPMVFDGFFSYLGFWTTNNTIRLFTGTYFGMAIPFFMIPAANFKVYGQNRKEIICCWSEILMVCILSLAICILILKTDLLPWLLISTMVMFSLIFIIGRIIFTIVIKTRLAGYRYRSIIIAGTTVGVICILFLISEYILRPLKQLLIN